MAIPFYNQSDQDIYAGGQHFIPQERFRLGYMAPPSIANAQTTSGITNTQAALPYQWPPQGGGGGGGGSGNKFGLNMDTLKTISQPRYVEQGGPANMYGGNYVKTDRQIAQDEHGNWKDVNTNQNVYHGNIQQFPSIIKKGFELAGLKQTGDPYAGTWYGSDWSEEDEDAGLYSKTLGPKNFIQRWKIKRDFKRAEAERVAQEKADAAAANQVQQNIQQYQITGRGGQGGDRPDTGINTPGEGKGQSPTGGNVEGTPFAQGGRIGLYAGINPDSYGGLIGYFDGGIARLL